MSFAETTARYRGIGTGGFTTTTTTTTTTDRGVLSTTGITADTCGESESFAGLGSQVVAAARDRGVEVVGEVEDATGDIGGVFLGRVRAGRGSLQGLWARSVLLRAWSVEYVPGMVECHACARCPFGSSRIGVG
jgi:hypothetical protein